MCHSGRPKVQLDDWKRDQGHWPCQEKVMKTSRTVHDGLPVSRQVDPWTRVPQHLLWISVLGNMEPSALSPESILDRFDQRFSTCALYNLIWSARKPWWLVCLPVGPMWEDGLQASPLPATFFFLLQVMNPLFSSLGTDIAMGLARSQVMHTL